MEAIVRKIDELAKRKSWINGEVNNIVSAFGVDRKAVGQGCLRLEDVYCVKRGRRYGPYGPYYYLYVHRPDKLQKTYVGKRADQLKVRKDAVGLLKDLEREYKRILKLERKLTKTLGLF
jgi:predicted transcriptional regulator